MSYRVFARKYRPQTFEEVIGQDSITTVLRNAIRLKRIAQAYLFVGPRGIGKTSTARILAKALNCRVGLPEEPCGSCDSCVEISESRSLDVLEIDGASHNGVENIRELRENVSFSPVRDPFKVYIIDEVHMLSAGAFNALLKTLEEPPPHVKFIFATTEIQKVPATISSRCQRFDLKRISPQLMASHLQRIASKENIDLEDSAARVIATAADGALRDAESMLDQAVAFCGNRITEPDVLLLFGLTPRQTVADLSALVFKKQTAEALALIAEQVTNGRDLSRLLGDWMSWLRDILIQQARADTAADPALHTQAALISQGKLLELLDLLADAQSRMKWTSDPQLQMDVTIIRAAHLLERANLDDVLQTLSLLADSSGGDAYALSSASRISSAIPTSSSILVSSTSVSSSAPPPAILPTMDREEVSSSTSEKAAEESLSLTLKKQRNKKGRSPKEKPPVLPEPSATMLWEEVSKEAITESPVKFGWLIEAANAAFDDINLRICFPKTFRTQFESGLWGDIQALLEKRLSQKRGSTTRLLIDWVEPPPQESSKPLLALTGDLPPNPTPSEDPLLPPEIPADPMEEFKNDPLIHKALEIFKGTIQTVTS